mmetsp:Transcript_21756/g.19270  ORF Transcript_21756/g.19270 Transcript_21756/m.19270 type:complete len:292 (+) Transcript_21756:164-1039(+)
MFYDPAQDDDSTFERIYQVQTIFDNPKSKDFDGESWIKDIKSGVQLMKIDISKSDLKAAASDYEVSTTPKLVAFDNYNIIVEETIGRGTYQKLKEKMTPLSISTPSTPPPPPSIKPTITPEPVVVRPSPGVLQPPTVIKPNTQEVCRCPPSTPCICPSVQTCKPVPCVNTGIQHNRNEHQHLDCTKATERAEGTANHYRKAYEKLEKEYNEFKKETAKEKKQLQERVSEVKEENYLSEAVKNIDFIMQIKNSMTAINDIQKAAREIEASLNGVDRQVTFKLEEWKRKYGNK